MPDETPILTWLHIGHLHVTDGDGENLADWRRIVASANGAAPGSIDFILLPGDNADDGEPDQFRLVRGAVAPLPAKLRAGAEWIGALIARPHVACVDMGHTHYNELANDGSTIFMATRSTGQIEEGPAGFSVAALDGGGASWRFKTLDQAWPLVLITAPVDRRLVTGASPADDGMIRAKVLGDAVIEAVECQIGDEAWTPMRPVPGQTGLWHLPAPSGSVIRVRARDAQGCADMDQVEPPHPGWTPPPRFADGSDRDSVGAWPAKGLFGTQLGPNRNGRKW